MQKSSKSITGNYLAGNSPHTKRNKGDFYQTPYHCTRLLLDHEFLPGTILEPAAGSGAITQILLERYDEVTSYDIEKDFFTETRNFDCIITNPPYRKSLQFIQHAKTIAQHKIAMLLPLNYLQGQKRFDNLYKDNSFKLKTVYVFTRYLLMSDQIRSDGTCGYGMITFAWFVWDKYHTLSPSIKWLDNSAFICR